MQYTRKYISIKKYYENISIITLLCLILLGYGCSRSEQQISMPEIKIITSENVHGVIAPDDDHIWLTGAYGSIYHSSNNGSTWTEQTSEIKNDIICDGSFIDEKTGWLVGISGTILHTTDGGENWIKQNSGTDKNLFSICFVDNNYGWAAGEETTVLHTKNGGKTWDRQTKVTNKALNNIVFLDKNIGWVVGERGLILHTDDGGETWSKQTPESFERESFEEILEDPPPSLFGVFFSDEKKGWACGIDGTIITTNDGGSTWNRIPPVTDLTLYTIHLKDMLGWAVGDKGAYLVSEDAGITWKYDENIIKTKQPLRDVYFSSPQQGWITGGAGTVIHSKDGGKTWEFKSGLSYAMDFFQMPKALEFGGGTE